MKKYLSIIVIMFVGCVLTSCGSDGESESNNKGSIEKFSDKTADKIVNQIKSPIDAARKAQLNANRETERVEKNLDSAN